MRRLIVGGIAFALISLFVMPVMADFFQVKTVLDEPGIDKNTLAQLMSGGELLIVRENAAGKLQLITSGILIDKPPATVYDVITDYEHYTEFMPSTDECTVVADNGNVKDIRFKITFKFVVSLSVEYTLRTWFKPNEEVTWNLLASEGDKITKTFGSWRLIPIAGGTKTAAFYSVYSDISNVFWGLRQLMKKIPSMDVALNASTCVLVLKATKNRCMNPNWVAPE